MWLLHLLFIFISIVFIAQVVNTPSCKHRVQIVDTNEINEVKNQQEHLSTFFSQPVIFNGLEFNDSDRPEKRNDINKYYISQN